jgi:hypothetical protein
MDGRFPPMPHSSQSRPNSHAANTKARRVARFRSAEDAAWPGLIPSIPSPPCPAPRSVPLLPPCDCPMPPHSSGFTSIPKLMESKRMAPKLSPPQQSVAGSIQAEITSSPAYVPGLYDIVGRGRMPAIVYHKDSVELLYQIRP